MSNESFISISDMMAYMNSGKPFSIIYITWDWAKGRGGAVKMVHQAVKHYAGSKDKNKEIVADKTSLIHSVKNPNHFFNSTTNIRVSAAGNADIRKVHIQLIRRFNGAIVK